MFSLSLLASPREGNCFNHEKNSSSLLLLPSLLLSPFGVSFSISRDGNFSAMEELPSSAFSSFSLTLFSPSQFYLFPSLLQRKFFCLEERCKEENPPLSLFLSLLQSLSLSLSLAHDPSHDRNFSVARRTSSFPLSFFLLLLLSFSSPRTRTLVKDRGRFMKDWINGE